jgi:hypothetical protein
VVGTELGRLRKEGVQIEEILGKCCFWFCLLLEIRGIEAIVEHVEAFSKYWTINVEGK